jgi:signal transduction histidine kinase
LLLAGVLAVGMAARVSRPLADLAEKTSRLDLDRLDQDFASDRRDEIGALGNLLSEMTGRLRTSTSRLREAERRAATGDLARQINHDVKNGLAPIRHVLRHLSETAARHPEQLAAVFADRRETLESSVTYLEGLARNYARLAPALDRGSSDLGALLQEVARGSRADGVEFEVRLGENLPPVRADAVVLRRIVENLVSNAVDALEGRPGRVTLSSEAVPNGSEPRVRLTVADTGRGMTAEELDRAFDDFHTTKTSGTGLGLSVVRRLVGDLGGTLRVETSPGQGSTFMVEILAL